MPSDSTFVPAEPWLYHSPEVHRAGFKVDRGLIAEALVYYDRVYFAITSDEQFARVVAWFQSQGATHELIALLRDGVLVPYYYAFATLAGEKNGIWSVVNIQDQEQGAKPVFIPRVLESGRLASLIRKASVRSELIQAAADRHVEVKAEQFGASLRNADADYQTDDRASFLLQIVLDELFEDMQLVKPPSIAARIEVRGPLRRIDWGFDLKEFERRLGPPLAMHPGTPLAAAAFGVKAIWSASQLKSDMYVGAPISSYIEYKLREGANAMRAKTIIEELVAEVAFPDVRALVNRGQLGFKEVMELRKKAERFRRWLREESELERNAVIAYHEEVAKSAGWTNARKVLGAAGMLGGAAAGAALAGPLGAVGGAFAGQALEYITGLASQMDQGWRPRVFGEWAKARIDRAVRREE